MNETSVKIVLTSREAVAEVMRLAEAENKHKNAIAEAVRESNKQEAAQKKQAAAAGSYSSEWERQAKNRESANYRFAASQDVVNKKVAEFARNSELVRKNQQVYSTGGTAGTGYRPDLVAAPLRGFAAAGINRRRSAIELANYRFAASQDAARDQVAGFVSNREAAAKKDVDDRKKRVADITSDNQSALDKYLASRRALNALDKELSPDIYRRAMSALKDEYYKTSGRVDKHAEALKKAEQAAKEAAAAEKRLVQEVNELKTAPYEKHIAYVERLKLALKSGKIDQQGFNAAVADSEKRFRAAAIASDESFGGKSLSALTSYVGQLATMGAVLGVARMGWQKLTAAQDEYLANSKKILDFNLTLAQVQSEAALNLEGVKPSRITSVLEQEAPALAGRTGFRDTKPIIAAIGETFARTLDQDIDLALEAVEAAARVTKHKPELLPLYSTMAADIQRYTVDALNPKGVSAEQGLSFGLQVNTAIKKPADVARNLPAVAAMAAAASKTDNNTEALRSGQAMLAAMTLFTGDPTGDSGATATGKLLEYTKEFFEKEHPDLDPGTPHSRVRKLEDNPQLREELEEHLSKKGAIEYREAIKAIYDPSTQVNRDYHAHYKRVNFDKDKLRDTEAVMSSTEAMRLDNAESQSEANKNELWATNEGKIRAKRVLAEFIRKESREKTDTWSETIFSGATGRAMSRASGMPEEEIAKNEVKSRIAVRQRGLDTWSGLLQDQKVTNSPDIKYLEKQLTLLEKISTDIADLQATNAKMANEPKALPATVVDPVMPSPSRPAPNANGGGRQ